MWLLQEGDPLTHFSMWLLPDGDPLTHFSMWLLQDGDPLTDFSMWLLQDGDPLTHFSKWLLQDGDPLTHFNIRQKITKTGRGKQVLRIGLPIARNTPSLCRSILPTFPASQLSYGYFFCFAIFA